MGWREFWDSTPYATRIQLEAWADEQRAQRDIVIFGAFQTAYFSRMEKLGSEHLERALGRARKPVAPQTDKQIGAAIFDWLKTSEALNGSARH